MRLRLVPLTGTFRRFGRAVRDLAAQLGKEVAFEVSGEETEADRAVADGLFELLVHVVRNAIDHGIEPADDRVAAGKAPVGRVRLSAWTARDRLVLEVKDDGRGIDPEAVRRRAVERGLLTPETAAALDDPAAIELIFAPGFSTAGTLTDISGRGIGMDAVRTGVQRLGGRVEVASEPGRGTALRLVLPQTVTLTALLAVRAGEDVFGVPVESVLEYRRVPGDRIVAVKQGRALAWRNRTVPVLSLADLMAASGDRPSGRDCDIVVIRAEAGPIALLVDGVLGRVEGVVRPLEGVFANLPGLKGTTILGDGRILLVLDLGEIVA